jgi:hypothetical protein
MQQGKMHPKLCCCTASAYSKPLIIDSYIMMVVKMNLTIDIWVGKK